jgi:hypothetical protein
VTGLRLAWVGLTGTDPGDPLSVRIRCLTPKVLARVAAGARRMTSWHPEGLPADPLEVLRERFDDGDDPDDGGLAGVREPRRPKPGPGHLSAALHEPEPIII